MNDLATAARDLAFLRRRVEGDRESPPAIIFYVWAAIVASGCILTDLYPLAAAVFWPVAGTTGGAISFWLGLRWSRLSGVRQKRGGVRHGLHWGGLIATLLLIGFVEGPRATDPAAFTGHMLLIVGLAYFYAGIHIHRVFFWVAGLEVAGYVVVVLFPTTPWSVLGLAIAAGLIGSGVAVTQPAKDSEAGPSNLRLET